MLIENARTLCVNKISATINIYLLFLDKTEVIVQIRL